MRLASWPNEQGPPTGGSDDSTVRELLLRLGVRGSRLTFGEGIGWSLVRGCCEHG